MKKIFAALPAIFITAALAGCSKPADGQLIDEFSEYNNTAESSELHGAPCLVQQEDMLGGAWVSNNNLYFFVPDNIYETTGCEISARDAVIRNGSLDSGEAADGGNMFLYDNAVYINSVSDPPVSALIYERYEPKLLSSDDLEGHCQIYKNNAMLGEAYFKNGKGTINGPDKEFPAEIYVNNDKITMTVDGETDKYDYYIIDKKTAQKPNSAFTTMSAFPDSCTYIYLVNGNDFIAIKKSKIITEAQTEKTMETAESVAEISDEPKNIFADYDESKFPMGIWQDNYIFRQTGRLPRPIDYVEIPDYYNYTESDLYTHEEWLTSKEQVPYEFDGEGHYCISLQTHDVLGKYTFEDNVLTLIFDIEFMNGSVLHAEYAFNTVREDNGYRLRYDPSKSSIGNMPDMETETQTSQLELSACLSSLFSNFEDRESFFLKYEGESDPDRLKNYIDYLEGIS